MADEPAIRPDAEEECAKLRRALEELTAEHERYRRSLFTLLHEDIPVDKERMLAMVGQQRPLRDMIEELKGTP